MEHFDNKQFSDCTRQSGRLTAIQGEESSNSSLLVVCWSKKQHAAIRSMVTCSKSPLYDLYFAPRL
jgi:hypothetical protein